MILLSDCAPHSLFCLPSVFVRNSWFWNSFRNILHQGPAICFDFFDTMRQPCAPWCLALCTLLLDAMHPGHWNAAAVFWISVAWVPNLRTLENETMNLKHCDAGFCWQKPRTLSAGLMNPWPWHWESQVVRWNFAMHSDLRNIRNSKQTHIVFLIGIFLICFFFQIALHIHFSVFPAPIRLVLQRSHVPCHQYSKHADCWQSRIYFSFTNTL